MIWSEPPALTSQPGGTSKTVLCLVFTTGCHPATTGLTAESEPRGLESSDAGADGLGDRLADCEAAGSFLSPPFASSSLSPPRTRKPVTPAATTTAAAATIATIFVRLSLPPPPCCGGSGGPSGVVGAFHPCCGCC